MKYEIRAVPAPGSSWNQLIDGLSIRTELDQVVISGEIDRREALYALISRLAECEMDLVSVNKMEPEYLYPALDALSG